MQINKKEINILLILKIIISKIIYIILQIKLRLIIFKY